MVIEINVGATFDLFTLIPDGLNDISLFLDLGFLHEHSIQIFGNLASSRQLCSLLPILKIASVLFKYYYFYL